MAHGFRFSLLAAALGALFAASGCAPACDRYCSVTAAYIENCLANGTQEEWIAARDTGFGYWGYADATEFEAGCKSDFADQLAAAADSGVLTQACEDEANDWALLESRGQCAELP
jgi:hypothetical protein